MRYDASPELIGFLHAPLANRDALTAPGNGKLRWQTRLLYKVPALRRFISTDQACLLLGDLLKRAFSDIEHSLHLFLREDHGPVTRDTVNGYVRTLAQYFQINLDPGPSSGQAREDWQFVENIVGGQFFAKLEHTCNRVTESLKLNHTHQRSILEHPRLWVAYYLSEVYFLMRLGLMEAHFQGRALRITPSSTLWASLKSHWLSEIFESSSRNTDRYALADPAKVLAQHGYLTSTDREAFVDYLLDKCLSIHPDYLSAKVKAHPNYALMRSVVYFAAHVEMKVMAEHRTVSRAELSRYIDRAHLDVIDSILAARREPTLDSPTCFVRRSGDRYERGEVYFKYGLKLLLGALPRNIPGAGKQGDFGDLLGKYFERDYLKNYLRKIGHSRWETHGEFTPGNNAKIQGYDIDLVLHDRQHDQYYFIQVKYSLAKLPIYLAEQCDFFMNASFQKGVLRQLLILKDNLDDESIRKKLNQHGLHGATRENSHFILLHNMPFLNFHQYRGVTFYEWNLFRNIMQDGKVHRVKDGVASQARLFATPRLEQPDRIVDAFFSAEGDPQRLKEQYAVYRDSYAHFTFEGLEVACKLI